MTSTHRSGVVGWVAPGFPVYRPGAAALALLLAAGCGRNAALECPPLDSTAAWARVNQAWGRETAGSWSHDSLRRVLLRLAELDQAARESLATRTHDSAFVHRLARDDEARAAELRAILDRFGLPTRTLVGAAGSDAAMLLVQHNGSLQERVLAVARTLPAGEVSPQALAMLEDRVRTHAGRLQRYGTQFSIASDGRFVFAPVESLAGLEDRRAAAGLPPMPQYVCLVEQSGIRIDRSTLPK